MTSSEPYQTSVSNINLLIPLNHSSCATHYDLLQLQILIVSDKSTYVHRRSADPRILPSDNHHLIPRKSKQEKSNNRRQSPSAYSVGLGSIQNMRCCMSNCPIPALWIQDRSRTHATGHEDGNIPETERGEAIVTR